MWKTYRKVRFWCDWSHESYKEYNSTLQFKYSTFWKVFIGNLLENHCKPFKDILSRPLWNIKGPSWKQYL
jgi:hypothetical protein